VHDAVGLDRDARLVDYVGSVTFDRGVGHRRSIADRPRELITRPAVSAPDDAEIKRIDETSPVRGALLVTRPSKPRS
jgi:hypothetical protein